MDDKVKTFFKNNIGYLGVLIVCIIYLSTSLFQIGTTGKTIGQILADGAIAFLLGTFINRIFDIQGMMNGERNQKVLDTTLLHEQTVLKITPKIKYLDNWCKTQTKEKLKEVRIKILSKEGLSYDDCFDKNGNVKDFTVDKDKLANKLYHKAEMAKLKCFNRAVHVKITPLTTNSLTCESGKNEDPYNFGRTKMQYERHRGLTDILSKVGTTVIFGYFGVGLAVDFSWSGLLWKALQVGIFVLIGIISLYNAYMYMVDEYRMRIVKKINELEKFDCEIVLEEKEESKQEEIVGDILSEDKMTNVPYIENIEIKQEEPQNVQ